MRLKKRINHLGEIEYSLENIIINSKIYDYFKGGSEKSVFNVRHFTYFREKYISKSMEKRNNYLKHIDVKENTLYNEDKTDKKLRITIAPYEFAKELKNREKYDFCLCLGSRYDITEKESIDDKVKCVYFEDNGETDFLIELFRKRELETKDDQKK